MWRTTSASNAAERPAKLRLVKRGMAHARADHQAIAVDREPVEPGDFVDVDQMRRLRQPERHDRHEALPARQHAAVLRRDLGQSLQRLIERPRHMADERRGLHAATRCTRLYANDKPQVRIVKPL